MFSFGTPANKRQGRFHKEAIPISRNHAGRGDIIELPISLLVLLILGKCLGPWFCISCQLQSGKFKRLYASDCLLQRKPRGLHSASLIIAAPRDNYSIIWRA